MDPLLDPEMAEWLRQKRAALGDAISADKKGQEDADRRALLMQFAQSYANKRPMPVAPRQVNYERQRFGIETGIEDKARSYSLDAFRALTAARGKPQDPDDGPPPAEWNAPSSIATRKEARSMGYGPRAPEAADPMKAPPSDVLRRELRANGKNPDIYPTTGAALSALAPRALIPEQIVEGEGGQLFRVPTKGPNLTPKPIEGPGGRPFIKDKDLSPAAGRDLSELATVARNFEALGQSFRDEFAGMGLTAGVQTGLARKLGSAGSKGQQELAEWWKDFDRLINLPQRNEMFGASLTPPEKQAWAEAQNINAGSDPAIVRRAFDRLTSILRSKVKAQGEALVADGYGADVIGKVTLGIVGGPDPAPAAGAATGRKIVERRRAKDGRVLVKYEDGSIGVEGE